MDNNGPQRYLRLRFYVFNSPEKMNSQVSHLDVRDMHICESILNIKSEYESAYKLEGFCIQLIISSKTMTA